MRAPTRSRSTRLILPLALACAMTAPVAARAQEAMAEAAPDDARTLFQRGQVAYSQGDYDAAVALWEQAYGLDPRPLLQWNLSQAYERLGRLEDAATALEAYLAHAEPTDEHQADARARLGSIRERIAATGVTLTGAPEGATVLIDGVDSGRLPRPDAIRVTGGSHRVVVRMAGFSDFTSTVVVPAGQSVEVQVEMSAAASGGDGGSAPVVPIILFSAGGAALVAGAIMGGIALGQAESAPTRSGPEADGARTLAAAADITLGIGIACGVIGLVILLTSSSDDSDPDVGDASATLRVVPFGDTTSAGLAATGSF